MFSVGVGSWNKIPCHTEGSGERPSHRVCVPDLAGSVLDEILSDSGPKQSSLLEFLENRPAEEQRRLNVLKTALADGEKSTVATRESRNAAALRKCSPDVQFLA